MMEATPTPGKSRRANGALATAFDAPGSAVEVATGDGRVRGEARLRSDGRATGFPRGIREAQPMARTQVSGGRRPRRDGGARRLTTTTVS